jgi:hypothetical protein
MSIGQLVTSIRDNFLPHGIMSLRVCPDKYTHLFCNN